MSTKAIRMVLSEMKKTHDWMMIDEAFQELEAIEREARNYMKGRTTREDADRLELLLLSIAEDAP